MIILPIGKVILYIQPVYLKSSTSLKIPELKRLIVSQGQVVVMEPALEDSYALLQQRMKNEVERVDKRFAPLLPAQPAPLHPQLPQASQAQEPAPQPPTTQPQPGQAKEPTQPEQ